MKVHEIYVYPIKSLRGVSLPTSTLTPTGLRYDRQFMLLKDWRDDAASNQHGGRYQNMLVSKFPQMCLFTTEITLPTADDPLGGFIEITYTNPTTHQTTTNTIPLHPDPATLKPISITMHQSAATNTFQLPDSHNEWFSKCFGFPVVIAWIAPGGKRPVLGNLAPNAAVMNPVKRREKEENHVSSESDVSGDGTASESSQTWLSMLVNNLPSIPYLTTPNSTVPEPTTTTSIPHNPSAKTPTPIQDQDYSILFADCSAYLVCSHTSLLDVSSRISPTSTIDITKFRPNIIVSGSPQPWEEDYWAELQFKPNTTNTTPQKATHDSNFNMILTSNCVRCTSINVDYATGQFATGTPSTSPSSASGGSDGDSSAPTSTPQIFKLLTKDRRVDSGHKYAPVFGRYGFLARERREQRGQTAGGTGDDGGDGGDDIDSEQKSKNGEIVLTVGDEVTVTKRNTERTVFKWPGIGGTARDDWFPV